ncbi:hypothetical protein M8J77_000622 [Diaphorina citri]|nr:hypothetical protein M8J77_000622 [Diaphorina citri]
MSKELKNALNNEKEDDNGIQDTQKNEDDDTKNKCLDPRAPVDKILYTALACKVGKSLFDVLRNIFEKPGGGKWEWGPPPSRTWGKDIWSLGFSSSQQKCEDIEGARNPRSEQLKERGAQTFLHPGQGTPDRGPSGTMDS